MKSKNYILVRAAMALLLTLLSSTGAWADDAKIIVWLNDGNKSEVLFADMPELTYADGYVSITSNSPSTTLSWPIENLQKLTFENTSTAIRDVRATGLDLLSEKFDAYDLSGKMANGLKKGVNIIRYSDGTTKSVYVK